MAKLQTTPELLIGTRNPGKFRELSVLLSVCTMELRSLDDFPQLNGVSVDETGDSYQANAQLKAVAYGTQTHMLTLAEDSGLEVVALKGFPGINSDRWLIGTYQEKNIALLDILDQLGPDIDRSARFVNVTCLYNPSDQSSQFFQGELLGSIALKPSGQEGFGYDPIFIPKGFTQSLAELGQAVKNKISARAQAIRHLVRSQKHDLNLK